MKAPRATQYNKIIGNPSEKLIAITNPPPQCMTASPLSEISHITEPLQNPLHKTDKNTVTITDKIITNPSSPKCIKTLALLQMNDEIKHYDPHPSKWIKMPPLDIIQYSHYKLLPH
jgi:hypothetical protein